MDRHRVRIVGDHPHRGATGTRRDDLPLVQGMWKVDLDPSRTGVEECYAPAENLRVLPREEDPSG